jgi:acetyltransferase-like isoleucine patch superfamily enzyme
MRELVDQVRIYRKKSAFLAPHESTRNRLRTKWQFLRRQAHVTWPLYGHVLDAFREDRLQIGPHTSFLAGVWLSVPGEGRLTIGRNCYINLGAVIHAYGSIEIGDFSGIGNYSFVSDATHKSDDMTLPFMEQGMLPPEPIVIGSNVWVGVHCVIMPGVTIGDRAIVAGTPARVIRAVDGAPPGTPA